MVRAQGIAKRYLLEKEKETSKEIVLSKLKSLDDILKFEYSQYVRLCFWCYEQPLSYLDWLKQPIKSEN